MSSYPSFICFLFVLPLCGDGNPRSIPTHAPSADASPWFSVHLSMLFPGLFPLYLLVPFPGVLWQPFRPSFFSCICFHSTPLTWILRFPKNPCAPVVSITVHMFLPDVYFYPYFMVPFISISNSNRFFFLLYRIWV